MQEKHIKLRTKHLEPITFREGLVNYYLLSSVHVLSSHLLYFVWKKKLYFSHEFPNWSTSTRNKKQ